MEERPVVGGPIPLSPQPVRHVLGVCHSWDRLQDPEGVIGNRLSRDEIVVVDDHPLAVVSACVDLCIEPGRRAGPAGVDGARSHPTPGRAGLDPRGGAFRQRRRAPRARGASYAGPLST